MTNNEKIIQTNPEQQVVVFMYLNYGAAIGRIHNDLILEFYSIKTFIESIIKNFTRTLTL